MFWYLAGESKHIRVCLKNLRPFWYAMKYYICHSGWKHSMLFKNVVLIFTQKLKHKVIIKIKLSPSKNTEKNTGEKTRKNILYVFLYSFQYFFPPQEMSGKLTRNWISTLSFLWSTEKMDKNIKKITEKFLIFFFFNIFSVF